MYRDLTPDDLSTTTHDRLWCKIAKRSADDCWEWQAARLPYGYGRMNVGRLDNGKDRVEYAHRIVYVLTHQVTIPAGMVVMHTCDNPPCCNPAHLRLGTPAENSQDRENKGRRFRFSTKRRTSIYGLRVLSNDDVLRMKGLYESGMTAQEVAKAFSVGLSTAQKALRMSGVQMRRSGRRTGMTYPKT